MSAPSSTSSSSGAARARRTLLACGVALAVWAAFVGWMELELGRRGVRPSVVDSQALWARERERATSLGSHALVLIGDSRMQLDADLEVLRASTGLEPVQLARDGSSFVPVLESLASDPAFVGTIIAAFGEHYLARPELPAERPEAGRRPPSDERKLSAFDQAEAWLTDQWRARLRSYAEAARPITSLELRIFLGAFPQYLVTLPDRSRLADFSRTDADRLMLQLLRRQGVEIDAVEALSADVESRPAFLRGTARIARLVAAVQARGGKVQFVVLPRSGPVKTMEERRYPRALFWDAFAAQVGAQALHFEDVPAMRELVCPDGSHLDYRQRAVFTRSMARALGLQPANARF